MGEESRSGVVPDGGSPRSLGSRATERHRRADELLIPLLGPAAQKLDLLPILCRLDAAPAPVAAHLRLPPRYALPRRPRAVPREGKHATEGALPPAWVPLCVAHFVARFVVNAMEMALGLDKAEADRLRIVYVFDREPASSGALMRL
jgi:hypothetical protein